MISLKQSFVKTYSARLTDSPSPYPSKILFHRDQSMLYKSNVQKLKSIQTTDLNKPNRDNVFSK